MQVIKVVISCLIISSLIRCACDKTHQIHGLLTVNLMSREWSKKVREEIMALHEQGKGFIKDNKGTEWFWKYSWKHSSQVQSKRNTDYTIHDYLH